MQKINKKASILLWSIFLSIILSVSFIGVSTKISKNLQNNSIAIEQKNIENIIKNKLKQKDFSDETLDSQEKIVFENPNNIKISLKSQQSQKLGFYSETGTIEVNILNGGPIIYSFKSLPSQSITASGIIENSNILVINLATGDSSGSLNIENIGGYSTINLRSDKDIIKQTINYKIIKKVGNKELIKTSLYIKESLKN